jgi:hypothetical protein
MEFKLIDIFIVFFAIGFLFFVIMVLSLGLLLDESYNLYSTDHNKNKHVNSVYGLKEFEYE